MLRLTIFIIILSLAIPACKDRNTEADMKKQIQRKKQLFRRLSLCVGPLRK
jgi:hypothetical protein